jgi:hypothetical protein
MPVSCCLKDKNAHHSALQETDIEGFHLSFRAITPFLRATLPSWVQVAGLAIFSPSSALWMQGGAGSLGRVYSSGRQQFFCFVDFENRVKP